MPAAGSGTPRVAIVIPVFNGLPQLSVCLESLSWAREDPRVDVIVVDSGSADGSREYVAAEHEWVHLVLGDPSMWWSAATNLGCRHAVQQSAADTIGLLNHDCTWKADDFEALLRCREAAPAAIHCSRVVRADGRLIIAGGGVSRSGRLTMRGLDLESDPGFPAGRVVWCGGMGVLVPVGVWQRLGGYDERAFPHYHADADFCLRAARIGVPTMYCPASTVVNDKASTGRVIAREGATLREVWSTLWDRRSSVNLRETVRFYLRHRGVRAVTALLHVYYVHLGSSAFRIGRRWRNRLTSGLHHSSEPAPSSESPSISEIQVHARGATDGGVPNPPEQATAVTSRPLRVLMVTDVWPTVESPGRGAFIRRAAGAVRERGNDVRVLLLRRWFPTRQVAAAAGRPQTLRAAVGSWLESCGSRPIVPPPVAAVEYTAPPMALSHDRWGRWALATGRPVMLRLARRMMPDVIHGHWASPSGHVAVAMGRTLGVPSVVSVHGAEIAFTARFRRRGTASVARVLREADAVVVNSSLTWRAVADLRGASEGIHLVWQAGDVLGERTEPNEAPRILSVGHITPAKGHDGAAAVLGGCRDGGLGFTWSVIGRGSDDQEQSFREALERQCLADVTTVRRDLTNDEVLDEMVQADIFLLLTRDDAYGAVFAEALGAGLAVVGSDRAGAIIDFAGAGAPVCAVDPDDAAAVRGVLLELLTDPGHLAAVRRESREWAAVHLGWGRHAERLEEVYRSLL